MRGRGSQVVDGGGLLNRCTGETPYRGFESLPLRHMLRDRYVCVMFNVECGTLHRTVALA